MDNRVPIKISPKPKDIVLKEKKTIEKIEESQELSNPQVNSPNIHKKKIYKNFLKILKRGKAIPAIVVAEILGVSRQTISIWLDTPQARNILSQNIEYHLSVISDAKDWKAHAYLIDTAKGKQDITNIQVNQLDGLTIIRR